MISSGVQVALLTVTNIVSIIFLGCFCVSIFWVVRFRKKFYDEYGLFQKLQNLRQGKMRSCASEKTLFDSKDLIETNVEPVPSAPIIMKETPFTRKAKQSMVKGMSIYD